MPAPTKETPSSFGFLKAKGGPQMCPSCSKAVLTVGIVISVLVLGGVFGLLSLIMGANNIWLSAVLTVAVAGIVVVVTTQFVGLPFAAKKIGEREPVQQNASKKKKPAVLCDGCRTPLGDVP